MNKITIIAVGNNCGYSKLQKGFEYNTLILPLETIIKMEEKEEDFIKVWIKMYIDKLKDNICPLCKSKNIEVNSKEMFWGCKQCGYGNWEKLLPDKQRKKFIEEHKIDYKARIYLEHDKEHNSVPKTRKKKDTMELQLTLF